MEQSFLQIKSLPLILEFFIKFTSRHLFTVRAEAVAGVFDINKAEVREKVELLVVVKVVLKVIAFSPKIGHCAPPSNIFN